MAKDDSKGKKPKGKWQPKPIFLVSIFIVFILSGISLGLWANTHFVSKHYIPKGIGNAFHAEALSFPNNSARGISIIDTLISQASEEVLVMADVLASRSTMDALQAAQRRGVRVVVILGKNSVYNQSLSPAAYLLQLGVKDLLQAHGTTFNQLIIIDQRQVIIGSLPFSTKAEQTVAATGVVVESPDLAYKFREYFKSQYQIAEKLGV